MWFEERSWSNLKLTEDLTEDWRDLWTRKVDFIVAALAYVWATTNFLNLPRLILDYGGLAFVSAYGVSLLVCCVPVILLELSVGQLTGRAPPQAFLHLSPIFRGVGVSQLLLTAVVLVLMTRYLGWLLIFGYHVLWAVSRGKPSVPWLSCKFYPELISEPCREAGSLANFTDDVSNKMNAVRAESSLIQFMNAIEKPSASIDDLGQLQLMSVIAYAAIWFIVFTAICYGVSWLSKMVTFFFFFAISAFFAVLVFSAANGAFISCLQFFYSRTDWERLLDYKLWKVAAEQALLATGCGFGAYITMASYCKRSNNVVRDTFSIVFSHAFFTLLQVLLVVSLVGTVAQRTGMKPTELIDRGENQMWHILAYFSYSSSSQWIPLWSGAILLSSALALFCVLFVLTLSLLAATEDACGEKSSRCLPRFLLAFLLCATLAGASLIFATQAGKHAYELAVSSLRYVTLWVILTAELFAVAWFYCAHRLGMELHSMLRYACCWCFGHFILFFTYLLPAVPAAIAYVNAREYSAGVFSEAIRSWQWWEWTAAAVAFVPLVPIPLFALATLMGACCCGQRGEGGTCHQLFGSRLRPLKGAGSSSVHADDVHYTSVGLRDSAPAPRYSAAAPGYLRLPQAPLAEPETYHDGSTLMR